MIGPLAFAACAPPSTESGECAPLPEGSQDAVAGPIECEEQQVSGGEAEPGEWRIENGLVRFGVRKASGALTRLGAAAGTIVDAAPQGGSDVLTEVVPWPWFIDATTTDRLEDDFAALTVLGAEPDNREIHYVLPPDSPVLEITADGYDLVPPSGSQVVGSAVEVETGRSWTLLGCTGALSDLGGWVSCADGVGRLGLAVGDRDTVYRALWPDGRVVSGTSDGEWVEALASDLVVGRFEVVDGAFEGRIPEEADALRATAEGFAAGTEETPGEGVDLPIGAEGTLRVRVTDSAGFDVPATLVWTRTGSSEAERWPLPPGGGRAPVGPGTGEAWVSAGPGYDAVRFGAVEVRGVVDLHAILEPVVTDAVLADLRVTAWPDPTERREAAEVYAAAAAEGVGYAVLVAEEEVAAGGLDGHTGAFLRARAGSLVRTDGWAAWGWPWTPDEREPAHGAVDPERLAPADVLALVDGNRGRRTAVDLAWAEAAGPAWEWDPRPEAVRLDSADDLARYAALLDGWVPLPAVGPLTWVEGVERGHGAAVDVEAAIVAGRTVATNGPRIVLEVDGQGPGSYLDGVQGPVRVRVRIEAPSWIPLDEAALVGPGGVELHAWPLSGTEPVRLDDGIEIAPSDWVVATCRGSEPNPPLLDEPAWAVTSPVWMAGP